MHGGDLVAGCLADHGVRTLFTLVGGHISPILVGARARGIRVIDVREEATAAFAADAMARLGTVPGVAVVTAGPGVTNTLTAVQNARLAQSPLVLIGGATATVLKGRGALQDIDQMAVVGPHVKWATAVDRVRDLVPAVRHAFVQAMRGVPGPVFVEMPVDLLYPEPLVRDWYFPAKRAPRGLREHLVRRYLEYRFRRAFAPSAGRAAGWPDPADTPAPTASALRRTAERLARSRRPVVLVGSQAVITGSDVAGVAEALDRLGVPVYLSGMARGLLGPSHPRQFRHQRSQALREADFVLLAGTPCDFRLDYGRQINARASIVAVNRDARDLTKNRRPWLPVLARPDQFLVALAREAGAPRDHSDWLAVLRERERARDDDIARRAAAPVSPINPLALCQAIDALLPEDSIIVADGGDFVATASYILRPRAPLAWLDPGVFGTLGVGAGFVLGVHASRPDAEIWAIYGDGALGFSLSEFDTLVRGRVPVIAVVGNDGKWAQIARDQVPLLGDDVATTIGRAAYHRVVEGFGARGFLLDDPSRTAEVLAEARRVARTGVPVLVNALIGDTDFRKGSISL